WAPPASARPEADDDGAGLRRAALARAVDEMAVREGRLFARKVAPGLAALGTPIHGWGDLDAAECERLLRLLDRRFLPILTPLAVDAGRPFPIIASRALNLVLQLSDPLSGQGGVAVVRSP